MGEYIVTCDEETASWIGNDVESMREIVRCRDCAKAEHDYVYRFDGSKSYELTCKRFENFLHVTQPDGFCAWSERRSDHD